jgi:hypothetical protein
VALKKTLLSSLVLVAIQILSFLAVHEITWRILVRIYAPKPDLFWGGTVRFAFILVSASALLGAVLRPMVRVPRWIMIQLGLLVIYLSFFISLATYSPYRFMYLTSVSALSFVSPIIAILCFPSLFDSKSNAASTS